MAQKMQNILKENTETATEKEMMKKVFTEVKERLSIEEEGVDVKELKRNIDIVFLNNFQEKYFENLARTKYLVNSWANLFIRTNCVIKLKGKK